VRCSLCLDTICSETFREDFGNYYSFRIPHSESRIPLWINFYLVCVHTHFSN
jgi:hypothetical protein